jgi:hypothetical protein
MELSLSQRQLSFLIKQSVNQRLKIYEQDASSDPTAAQPTAGTSANQSGGQGYPEVGKWESGIERGPGNQISITKWSDVVGSKLTRGHANQLKEQDSVISSDINQREKNLTFDFSHIAVHPSISKESDHPFVQAINKQNELNKQGYIGVDPSSLRKVSGKKYIYSEDDGHNFFFNIAHGNLSNAILDLRSFMFSGWGIAAQLVVGVLGAEVGAPVALEYIDGIIMANDLIIFARQGMNDVEKFPTTWDEFKDLLETNPDFLRVAEDALILTTMGVGKLVGKAAKGAGRVIKGLRGKFPKFRLFTMAISKALRGLKSFLLKAPKFFQKYLRSNVHFIDRLISFFEKKSLSTSKISRMIGKIPLATGYGLLGIFAAEVGIPMTMKLFGLSHDEVQKPNDMAVTKFINSKMFKKYENDPKSMQENLLYDVFALKQFPGLQRNQFKLTDEKSGNDSIFIINGNRYVGTDASGQFKFQKI